MHVQPRFLRQVEQAVTNGREVEKLLQAEVRARHVGCGTAEGKGRCGKKGRGHPFFTYPTQIGAKVFAKLFVDQVRRENPDLAQLFNAF